MSKTEPTPEEPPKEPEGGTKPEPPKKEPNAKTEPDRTFSQEDVDRIITARLKEQEPRYKELREKAQKYDEVEEQNRSELEKAQGKAEKAEQERDEAVKTANRTLIRAAVVAEAAKQGAVDPDAVVALLPSDQVTVGDDGQVTGAEKAVTGLLESKQYLVGDATPPGPGDGGARTPVKPKDLEEQIREAESKGDVRESIRLKSLLPAGGQAKT